MKNEKWFALGIPQVETKLKTNAASGLSRKAARSRVNRNVGSLFYVPRKAPVRLFTEILSDFALIILLLVATVSLFFEEGRRHGLLVLILLVISLASTWILYYRSQRTVESLSSFFYPVARVIRGGKLFYVDFRSVVPGDVILLEAGDVLGCDARLVSSDHLSVRMRVDKKNYVLLEKDAGAQVRSGEHHAQAMRNMVHAGSIIETGSARAIVTAVGKYTYLGAMTGGIALPLSRKTPEIVKKLRKHCSKVNMLFLIAVLPLTMVSLLLCHMVGGDVKLSIAFLTTLSLVATTMSQLLCTISKLFYTYKIRQLLKNSNPSVIRSVEAFDQLASVDYLFLLDGCALTDGVLHFQEAVCTDGEIRNYAAMGATAKNFSELVSLYHTAATRTLTTGVSNSGTYMAGIREFIQKSGVDEGALQIRCSILSYMPSDMNHGAEQVYYVEQGKQYCLSVTQSVDILSSCDSVMVGGKKQPLRADGIQKLEAQWRRYVANYCTPLIFTVSETGGLHTCFVGFLLLKEGVDPHWSKNIAYMEKSGCQIIAFTDRNIHVPSIPVQLLGKERVSKNDFLKNKLPLTYQFGRFCVYSGFENEDILSLIHHIHRQNKSVAVIGFTDTSLEVADLADCFITCAPIHVRTTGYLDEEIRTMELAGQQYSASCTQVVKEKADVLLPRPKQGRGGLASLATAIFRIKTAYLNLSGYLRYLVCTQVMRLLISVIPMLFGTMILDARHILFCSCILDILVLLMFLDNNDPNRNMTKKNYCAVNRISDYFTGDSPMMLATLVASGSVLILPELLGWLSFAGTYDGKKEFAFIAMILLHLTAVTCLYYGKNIRQVIQIYRNKFLMSEILIVLVFLVLCLAWEQFGELFELEVMLSAPYLLLTVVPSCIFVTVFFLVSRPKKHQKIKN